MFWELSPGEDCEFGRQNRRDVLRYTAHVIVQRISCWGEVPQAQRTSLNLASFGQGSNRYPDVRPQFSQMT